MRRALDLVQAFAAPIGYVIQAPASGGRSFTAASLRQGVLSLATEVGGGGQVTPASLALMQRGMRRLLAATGLVDEPLTPLAESTRLTEVGGDDFYEYASEDGLFEPLVDIGAEVEQGQAAARVHFHRTPWREPLTLHFQRAGIVLCKRVPALCERGDCLFQLATDIAV
jgi:predicted deacylase